MIQVAIALLEPLEIAVDLLEPAVGLGQLAGAPPQGLLGEDAFGDVDEVTAQLDRPPTAVVVDQHIGLKVAVRVGQVCNLPHCGRRLDAEDEVVVLALLERPGKGLFDTSAISGVDDPEQRATVEALHRLAEELLQQRGGGLPAEVRCQAADHLLPGALERKGRVATQVGAVFGPVGRRH